jgi:hypothetical protein
MGRKRMEKGGERKAEGEGKDTREDNEQMEMEQKGRRDRGESGE